MAKEWLAIGLLMATALGCEQSGGAKPLGAKPSGTEIEIELRPLVEFFGENPAQSLQTTSITTRGDHVTMFGIDLDFNVANKPVSKRR